MKSYEQLLEGLRQRPTRWLVTGAAGFIGSNLVEALLRLNQPVRGMDNFATGHRHNLDDVRRSVGPDAWENFSFVEGDIREADACQEACDGIDVVLHQAALGSVPRSIADPVRSNATNIDGFLNMLVAARDRKVQRFVYAASSSTYGDHPALPKQEDRIGSPLSPYAVTKLANELYARVFERNYGLKTIGLRYFNVFGRRQDPDGPYAAVIPRWIGNLLEGSTCTINGDGENSRDFCYIDNVIQANIRAALLEISPESGSIFNVAVGGRTSLNELFDQIRDELATFDAGVATARPVHGPTRAGDVAHSQADIGKISSTLGYVPTHDVADGIRETVRWYVSERARQEDPLV